MAYSPRRGRYDYSPSPPPRYRSRSRSRSPARRYNDDPDSHNPGNNLYVTGLSVRVTERELEEHLSREGKVTECHLVVDPRTKESRGFGFVTMDSVDDAERCIKYLNKSILEGRVITVEKNLYLDLFGQHGGCAIPAPTPENLSNLVRAKRRRARTPTPGTYLGVRTSRGSSSYDYNRRRGYSDSYSRRSPRYSPYRSERDYSPRRSPYRSSSRYRDRSLSPRYSPYGSPRRSYRSSYRSRSRSRSASPY